MCRSLAIRETKRKPPGLSVENLDGYYGLRGMRSAQSSPFIFIQRLPGGVSHK